MNISDGSVGPWWWIGTGENVLIVLALQLRQVSILYIFGSAAAGKRKQDVVDECDGSCRAFNVEQNASCRHYAHPAINARPRQTGSKFLSTPLSVYHGVHPDDS